MHFRSKSLLMRRVFPSTDNSSRALLRKLSIMIETKCNFHECKLKSLHSWQDLNLPHQQHQDGLIVKPVLAALEAGHIREDGVGEFDSGEAFVGAKHGGKAV